MLVHAEYFRINEATSVRGKTLLHFGKSTNIIGSAVLINPGSAAPIGPANMELINAFFTKNHPKEVIATGIWQKFRPDATMLQLEKVFNGWYVGRERPLKGIIQLFNCFYVKQKDLDKALVAFQSHTSLSFAEQRFLKDQPVYFGWGTAGKTNTLIRPIAKTIFNTYTKGKTSIYQADFDNNSFYHPGYLNRSFNRNEKSKAILSKFSDLIST